MCHESMKPEESIIVIRLALRSAYKAMVARRLEKVVWYGHIRESILNSIETKLRNAKLAKLFVEAQFFAMPREWCLEKFGKPYPPANVVFGGNCWERYKTYVDRGVRDGT